jgi:hypothetical protein
MEEFGAAHLISWQRPLYLGHCTNYKTILTSTAIFAHLNLNDDEVEVVTRECWSNDLVRRRVREFRVSASRD